MNKMYHISIVLTTILWIFGCVVEGHPQSESNSLKGNCVTAVSAFPPDPKSGCCGVSSSVNPEFSLGSSTLLDQYPWTALIEYDRNGTLKTLCYGSLISGRYVLTAAHCTKIQPVSIRLGEYDTSHAGIDCVEVSAGGKDCNEGAISIPIEKITVHPEFNSTEKSHRNDIALIRIKELAPYTDFIRPICLPTEDITLRTDSIKLTKTAWEPTSPDQHKASDVKMLVTAPFVKTEDCQTSYDSFKISLWKGQLCAGGQDTQDFCRGDGGSALMYNNSKEHREEVVGIVSFGPKLACSKTIPLIYTNVYEYNSWIKSNIVE